MSLHLGSFVVALGLVAIGRAAETPLPAGWHVHFTQKLGVFEDTADSVAPAAAFVLEGDQTLHPVLRATGWTATYRTRLAFPQPGTYRLAIEGEGGTANLAVKDPKSGATVATCRLDAAGRAETQWVKLDGARDVEVTFSRTGRGRARLRTLWEMGVEEFGGFRMEPIPAYVVAIENDTAATAARRGLAERQGRVVAGMKGCTQCHAIAAPANFAFGDRPAPNLGTTARFATLEWIAKWVRDPSAVRPHADMPTLLDREPNPDDSALDLAHYVKSMVTERTPAADWQLSTGAGRKLFHQLGCVACHGALDAPRLVFEDPQQSGTIPEAVVHHPFGDLAGKWTRGPLAEFLRDPLRLHRDGLMPNFKLTETDARALADYLVVKFSGKAGESAVDAPKVDPARAERGSLTYARLKCDGCHGVPQNDFVRATTVAPPLASIAGAGAKGCLDPAAPAPARYSLKADDRAALLAALEALPRASGVAAPIDRANGLMQAANCYGCHRKDTLHGVDPALSIYFHSRDDRVDLGDEGRLPPDLTSVGFKLDASWLRQVLRGDGIAREYLGVRMPSFERLGADALAVGLAAEMGTIPDSDAIAPIATDSSVSAGRQLVGATGMNCIGCHQYKDTPPVGSPGPRVDEFAARLRYEWWTAYIQQPARFKPGTRMPSFALGRKSTYPALLDGDIYRQGDALWSYFTLGENMPPPAGIAGKDALKLVVGSEPRVLRTFLERSGNRGIAVGMPVGVHHGFDADQVRLAEIWQGDFLDATGAWAGRGGTPCAGQGQPVWSAPPGPPLLATASPPASWPPGSGKDHGYRFLGYRFESNSAPPTFRYAIGDCVVNERIVGRIAPVLGATREFSFEGPVTTSFVLRPGKNASEPKAVYGFDVAPVTIEGEPCYSLAPQFGASSYRFEIEVKP